MPMYKKEPDWGYARHHGNTRDNARMWCELHPRINDWICAAPIIGAVQFNKPMKTQMLSWAHGGFRLKAVLRALGIPNCLAREDAIHAHSTGVWLPTLCRLGHGAIYEALKRENFSTVLTSLASMVRALPDCPDEGLVWAIKNGHEHGDFDEVKDLFEAGRADWKWSAKRMQKEHQKWVDELRIRATQENASKPENQKVYLPNKGPEEFEHEGVIATLIKTKGGLMVESAMMNHCVGGENYRDRLQGGTSVFYHLESKDGASTLELRASEGDEHCWVEQHKGPSNASPSVSHFECAQALAEQVIPRNPMRRWQGMSYGARWAVAGDRDLMRMYQDLHRQLAESYAREDGRQAELTEQIRQVGGMLHRQRAVRQQMEMAQQRSSLNSLSGNVSISNAGGPPQMFWLDD